MFLGLHVSRISLYASYIQNEIVKLMGSHRNKIMSSLIHIYANYNVNTHTYTQRTHIHTTHTHTHMCI